MGNARQIVISPLRKARGGIALSAVGMLFVSVLFLTLLVDTGRLFYEQRSIQQKADLAAIEAAQVYCAGFNEDNYNFGTNFQQSVEDALARNHFDVSEDGYDLELLQYGQVISDQSRRELDTGGEPNAIGVRLKRTLPASVFRGFQPVTMTAEATAQRDMLGTLSVGSNVAQLDTRESRMLNALLGGLLDTDIALDIALQNLADVHVNLADIISAEGSVADAEALLQLDISVSEWFDILDRAMETPNSSMSDFIAEAIASNPGEFTIEDILHIHPSITSDEALLQIDIPIADLILNSLFAAHRDNGEIELALESNGTILDSLLGDALQAYVAIHHAPRTAVGRFGQDQQQDWYTEASGPALNVRIVLDLAEAGSLGDLLDVSGLFSDIEDQDGAIQGGVIELDLEVSDSGARLQTVDQCPGKLDRHIAFEVSSYYSGVNLSLDADSLLTLTIPDVTSARIGASISSSGQEPYSGSDTHAVDESLDSAPFQVKSDSQFFSSLFLGDIDINFELFDEEDEDSLICGLPLLGIGCDLVGDIIDELVSAVLTPIVNTLANETLLGSNGLITLVLEDVAEPLLNALGVRLGGVDIRVTDIEEGSGDLKL